VIRVERGWDGVAGEALAPKSKSGIRTIPIPLVLRLTLVAYRLSVGNPDAGLVFPSDDDPDRPISYGGIRSRAKKAWAGEEWEDFLPHSARHSYASFAIGAGVNAKALSKYMGHASIQVTFDRYGHLFPGNEGEAAALLDEYFGESEDQEAA
jgi:integrase